MRNTDLSSQLPGISRVLVRVNNWIGDVVMSIPTITAIRRTCPGASITALARPVVAPILEGNPDIDEILIYDDQGRHAGLRGMGRLIREVRGRRFELALLYQRAFEAAFLARASSIPIRAGYGTDGRRLLLTHPVPRPKTGPVLHRVEDDLRLLATLGFSTEETGRPTLSTTTEEDEDALRRLARLGLNPDDLLVGIHPGAAYGAAKMWPAGRYVSLAGRLSERIGARIILFGSAEERGITSMIAAAGSSVIDLAGRTSLREALALIKRCNLFISNDSGLIHAAAALGLPVVAIFGPTNPAATAPFSPLARVVRVPVDCSPCRERECPVDHRCMLNIGPEMVLDAAVELLRNPSAETGGPDPDQLD